MNTGEKTQIEIMRFFRFSLVGASSTALSLFIYYLLVRLGVYYIIANVLSYFLSLLNAYLLNRYYVFKKAGENHKTYILKTFISYGFTLLLGTCILYILVNILGISKYYAPLINLTITVPVNYLLNKTWVYR